MRRNYFRNCLQEIMFGGSKENFWFTPNLNGVEVVPTSAPALTVCDQSGTVLLNAVSMTAATPVEEGYLLLKTCTVHPKVGELLTQATSGATGTVYEVRPSGTTNRVYLVGITGTWATNLTITGSEGATCTADGALFSLDYYYQINASTKTTWKLGALYPVLVTFPFNSLTYTRTSYLDVVPKPFLPMLSSGDINRRHPNWITMLPEAWDDWQPAIEAGFADLAMDIRKVANKQPGAFTAPEELADLLLAFIEVEITRGEGFDKDTRAEYKQRKADCWDSLPSLHYDANWEGSETQADEDLEVTSTAQEFTR